MPYAAGAPRNNAMSPFHIFLAVMVAAIFGFGFVPSKIGVASYPPLWFLAVRFALVSLFLLWFIRVPRGQWRAVLVFALIMGIGHFSLSYLGMKAGAEASLAALLWVMQAPISAALALVFLGERMHWRGIAGLLLAIVGAVVLLGEPRHIGNYLGIALVGGSAVLGAVANILGKRLGAVEPLTLQGWSALVALPVLVALSFIFEEGQIAGLVNAPWEAHGSLLYLVFLSSMLGYGTYWWLLKRYTVATTVSIFLMVPAFGAAGGVAVLGDAFTWQSGLGAAGMLGGVALLMVRRERAAKTAPVNPES